VTTSVPRAREAIKHTELARRSLHAYKVPAAEGMSDPPGMVTTLMETNRTSEQSESTAPAPAPRYVELQQLLASVQSDFEKFYRDGNKAAGTRVRNAMQELKTLAQTIRTEVQAIKNEGKPSSDEQPD
jgi:flagellar biosynthesis/type III secretory pathway protein FliH